MRPAGNCRSALVVAGWVGFATGPHLQASPQLWQCPARLAFKGDKIQHDAACAVLARDQIKPAPAGTDLLLDPDPVQVSSQTQPQIRADPQVQHQGRRLGGGRDRIGAHVAATDHAQPAPGNIGLVAQRRLALNAGQFVQNLP